MQQKHRKSYHPIPPFLLWGNEDDLPVKGTLPDPVTNYTLGQAQREAPQLGAVANVATLVLLAEEDTPGSPLA